MPCIFLPDGVAAEAPLTLATTGYELHGCMRRGEPALYHDYAGATAHVADGDAQGLRLTINRPSRVEGRMQCLIRWRFCRRGGAAAWSGRMSVKISTPLFMRKSIDLVHGEMTKAAITATDQDFAADLDLLSQAIALLTREANLDILNLPLEARSILHANPSLAADIQPILRALRQTRGAEMDAEKARRAALRAAFKAIPHGTPLAIWTKRTGTWQIGLKGESADTAFIRNSALLPPEILRDQVLRDAGLSAHAILPLIGKAEAALRDHPAFARPDLPQRHDLEIKRLDAETPLHASWIEIKERPVAAAYIATRSTPDSAGSFAAHRNAPPRRQRSWGDDMMAPPYPVPHANPVELIAVRPVNHTKLARPGFYRLGGLLCLRDTVIDVLAAHNLRGIRLVETLLRDNDQSILPGRWAHIAVEESHSAFIPDPVATSYGPCIPMPDKAWGLRLDAQQIEGADMWWDEQISGRPFFFSPRLVQALRRIKAPPPLALKPCLAA